MISDFADGGGMLRPDRFFPDVDSHTLHCTASLQDMPSPGNTHNASTPRTRQNKWPASVASQYKPLSMCLQHALSTPPNDVNTSS